MTATNLRVHVCAALFLVVISVSAASAQDTWATRASDPGVMHWAASGEINGRIYVAGFDRPIPGNPASYVPRLSVYDPATNTWTTAAPPTIKRAGASAGVINGKLYVVGGCIVSDCNYLTNQLEIYNPATNSWSNGAPMPTTRFGAAAGVIDGKLYVTAGSFTCGVCNPTTQTEIYDGGGPGDRTRRLRGPAAGVILPERGHFARRPLENS